MMDIDWYKMTDVRRRFFNSAAWIPLKASQQTIRSGQSGEVGFKEEFFGVGTLAVFQSKKQEAEELGWSEIGLMASQRPYVDSELDYKPAEVRMGKGNSPIGIYLVLTQDGSFEESGEWHLNQDFVFAFDLKRENDTWLSKSEGYIEVARLIRKEDGAPDLLEVRAEYLKEYLFVRKMALRLSSYRSRVEIVKEPGELAHVERESLTESNETESWELRVTAIGDNGMPFGSKTAVLHLSRTDVDDEEDIPVLGFPGDDAVKTNSYTISNEGEKSYRIHGELWRDEWIDPGSLSPRIMDNEPEEKLHFIVDASGNTETKETLVQESRWLWFKPEVMNHILSIRGSALGWYTRYTGSIRCSPGYGLHFGINSIGLINILAKDIALLPLWQQKIWIGFNVRPDGKVCSELLASQMRATPASTKAPEDFLERAKDTLNNTTFNIFKKHFFKDHGETKNLIHKLHRFRSTDVEGLLALAKDTNKFFVETIDKDFFKLFNGKINIPGYGTIKLTETLLSTLIKSEDARKIMAPLAGVYDLRIADAHLRGSDFEDAFNLAGINKASNYIEQGFQLLSNVVTSIYTINDVVKLIPPIDKGVDTP